MGREPYGNGASVVVRGRESRLHGEGRQVFQTPKYGGMRNADSRRSIERHQEKSTATPFPKNTGEPDDGKLSNPVRRGADGKVA
jgi:hypothetical protein